VFVCVCVRAFFCVCVQVEAFRRAYHPLKESYRFSKIWKTDVKHRVSWSRKKAQIGVVEPKKYYINYICFVYVYVFAVIQGNILQ
jgi:hypothetical protein